MQSFIKNDIALTPIQQFYDGQSVFVTGSTGFLGKLLLEKLLRSCPTLKRIYILIRAKKGKTVSERETELFEDSVFMKLKEEQPQFRDRIVTILGDCSLPNLGMMSLDRAHLAKEVSIIFHVAAIIRFNVNIKLATDTNVRCIIEMIKFSKEMPNLKSFVYVSTIYSNCPQNLIEEKFYDPPIDLDKLFDLIDNKTETELDDITPTLLGSWPNTYTYTKSIAENIIKQHAGLLPIGIIRPGIVISTYREPVPGWVDNFNGPMGIIAGATMGILRSHHCDGSVKVCLLPGDMTTNATIVSAWDIANNRRSNEDIPIYNYTSKDNPITYSELKRLAFKYALMKPTMKAKWYYSFRITKYRWLHLIYVFFLHLLPAFLIDTVTLCIGKKPRTLRMYMKYHTMLDVLQYFSNFEWTFGNERLIEVTNKLTETDQELFFYDMKKLVWNDYFENFFLGIRLYALKDPIETLPQAQKKFRRFFWMHQAMKLAMVCILFLIIFSVIYTQFFC